MSMDYYYVYGILLNVENTNFVRRLQWIGLWITFSDQIPQCCVYYVYKVLYSTKNIQNRSAFPNEALITIFLIHSNSTFRKLGKFKMEYLISVEFLHKTKQ